jgi:hypothetical protein
MLTHNLPRAGDSRSMGRSCPYVVGACSAILAMVSIIVVIEILVATTWSGVPPPLEIVNRTGKGDRLPPVQALNVVDQLLEINVSRKPALNQQLADGCESLASSLAHSPLAQIAGRCLS